MADTPTMQGPGKWLLEWLRERRDNARRLADAHRPEDRAGWLEDAAYFDAAASAVESLRRPAVAREVVQAQPASAPMGEPIAWLPNSENINALPVPVREYIMHLETICDPAGLVRENAQLRDTNRGLQVMYRNAVDAAAPAQARMPLSEEQIVKIAERYDVRSTVKTYGDEIINFARAVEAAHGVGVDAPAGRLSADEASAMFSRSLGAHPPGSEWTQDRVEEFVRGGSAPTSGVDLTTVDTARMGNEALARVAGECPGCGSLGRDHLPRCTAPGVADAEKTGDETRNGDTK